MTEDELKQWMMRTLGDVVGIDPSEVDPREKFSYYGLGSTEAVMIVGELEELLDCSFPESLALDYPCIEELTRHISENMATFRLRAP